MFLEYIAVYLVIGLVVSYIIRKNMPVKIGEYYLFDSYETMTLTQYLQVIFSWPFFVMVIFVSFANNIEF